MKLQRTNHDAHDILLGVLYYFPENAKWDEISFHEAFFKLKEKSESLITLSFEEVAGSFYCEDLGKVFDLLELSGLLKRKEEFILLELDLIKAHFDEEIKVTFSENDLMRLYELSEELQKALGIN